MDILTQSEMAQEIANRTNLTEDQAADLLTHLFNIWAEAVAKRRPILARGFGGFYSKSRAPRTYILNGERHHVPGHMDVKFNPSPAFIRDINRYLKNEELKYLETQD